MTKSNEYVTIDHISKNFFSSPYHAVVKECIIFSVPISSCFSSPNISAQLKAWIGVCKQLSKVSLEPSTRLWSRLKRICESAVEIVSCSAGVGSSLIVRLVYVLEIRRGGDGVYGKTNVAFSTGLDPDKCIFQCVSCVCGWSNTESGADEVAPVTPGELGGWLNTIATYFCF